MNLPMSRFDMNRIIEEINRARADGFEPDEVHVSAARIAHNFRLWGIPVRRRDELALHEMVLVALGRHPREVEFESVAL